MSAGDDVIGSGVYEYCTILSARRASVKSARKSALFRVPMEESRRSHSAILPQSLAAELTARGGRIDTYRRSRLLFESRRGHERSNSALVATARVTIGQGRNRLGHDEDLANGTCS